MEDSLISFSRTENEGRASRHMSRRRSSMFARSMQKKSRSVASLGVGAGPSVYVPPDSGTLREGVLYGIFLLLFMLVTLLSKGGTDLFYYVSKVKDSIVYRPFDANQVSNFAKYFGDIVVDAEVFEFMEGPLVEILLKNKWYNDNEYSPDELGMIMQHNRLLGGIRLRQVRVAHDSCSVPADYKTAITYCYGSYSESNEDKTGFGPITNVDAVTTASSYLFANEHFKTADGSLIDALQTCRTGCEADCWPHLGVDRYKYKTQCASNCYSQCACVMANGVDDTTNCPDPGKIPDLEFEHSWQSEEDLQDANYDGYLEDYPGNGFVTDLPVDADAALAKIQELKANRWIDLGTRLIVIDASLYNAMLDSYLTIRLAIEFSPTGGTIPRPRISIVPLNRYSSTEGFILGFLEFVLCCFVVFYTVQELRELSNEGFKQYFSSLWNAIDIANLVVFYLVIILRLYWLDLAHGILGFVDPIPSVNPLEIPRLFPVVKVIEWEYIINAFNGWLMWFKVFKYAQVSKRMSFLLRMLGHASADIFFFCAMFIIIFVGFAQAGYLAFSVDVADFRTIWMSLLTLFRSIMGDLDYVSLRDANAIFGPFFYIFFYVIVLLILLNVFLAILNDAYAEVRSQDMSSGAYEKKSGNGGFGAMFRALFGKGDKNGNNNNGAMKNLDKDGDNKVDKDELAAGLVKTGHTGALGADVAAQELIDRFDVNGDGALDDEELSAIEDMDAGNEEDCRLLEGIIALDEQLNRLHEDAEKRSRHMTKLKVMLKRLSPEPEEGSNPLSKRPPKPNNTSGRDSRLRMKGLLAASRLSSNSPSRNASRNSLGTEDSLHGSMNRATEQINRNRAHLKNIQSPLKAVSSFASMGSRHAELEREKEREHMRGITPLPALVTQNETMSQSSNLGTSTEKPSLPPIHPSSRPSDPPFPTKLSSPPPESKPPMNLRNNKFSGTKRRRLSFGASDDDNEEPFGIQRNISNDKTKKSRKVSIDDGQRNRRLSNGGIAMPNGAKRRSFTGQIDTDAANRASGSNPLMSSPPRPRNEMISPRRHGSTNDSTLSPRRSGRNQPMSSPRRSHERGEQVSSSRAHASERLSGAAKLIAESKARLESRRKATNNSNPVASSRTTTTTLVSPRNIRTSKETSSSRVFSDEPIDEPQMEIDEL
eukprot:TRINITY_DN10319_c0_g2_i1.p1 TRINITY_DN10319_c0_g2~~TRINITY_DN10319_c0_g2_i1.p1  ORF type:complete len:1161 (+),score=355.17 TRINITY_DN10319_c0_g2_i1:100-3582(+)